MSRLGRLLRDRRASAAAEMALVTPLLCTILIGSVESGSYFYNQHILAKAVRDGARYAARQNFSYYGTSSTCTNPTDATLIANVRALVRTSVLANGTDRFPDIQNADITLTATCKATEGGQSMTGIYAGRTIGAPIVKVAAIVDYAPVIGAPFGFSGVSIKIRAEHEAAVQGI